jgi:hypothetical protein
LIGDRTWACAEPARTKQATIAREQIRRSITWPYWQSFWKFPACLQLAATTVGAEVMIGVPL